MYFLPATTWQPADQLTVPEPLQWMLIAMLGLAAPAVGQVRLGFVDLQRALNETSEGNQAKRRLKGMFNKRQRELDKMQKRLKRMEADLKKQKGVLSDEAFAELPRAVRDIERGLQAFRPYDKINYLMLMMSDPHVHFHVLPRHASPRTLCGIEIADEAWPVAPDVTAAATRLSPEQVREVAAFVGGHWPGD